MVSALDSGSGGPGSSPGWGHCVVFLGKTLYSHSAHLRPGVQMGTSKCAGGNPVMDLHPIQGGGSNTPSRVMLRKPELNTSPMGHLGPYKGFTFFFTTITIGPILTMTSAQVVETSATTTYNSPSQEYTNLDNYTTLSQKIK